MKYLVAFDGSDAARKAFQHALHLLNESDEVILLSVQDTSIISDYILSQIPKSTVDESKASRRSELERTLQDLVKIATHDGSKHIVAKVLEGKPGDVILEEAGEFSDFCNPVEKEKVGTIVLGSKGLNPFTKLVIGSTTEYVAKFSKCSVLIVK